MTTESKATSCRQRRDLHAPSRSAKRLQTESEPTISPPMPGPGTTIVNRIINQGPALWERVAVPLFSAVVGGLIGVYGALRASRESLGTSAALAEAARQ